jgi:hypothetical protein
MISPNQKAWIRNMLNIPQPYGSQEDNIRAEKLIEEIESWVNEAYDAGYQFAKEEYLFEDPDELE